MQNFLASSDRREVGGVCAQVHRKAQIPYGQQNWKEPQKLETVWVIHLFVLHAFSTVGGALQVLGQGVGVSPEGSEHWGSGV